MERQLKYSEHWSKIGTYVGTDLAVNGADAGVADEDVVDSHALFFMVVGV